MATQSKLPGFNTLLEGPTGTGKTYSIGTLVDTGLEVFYLSLESGLESLLGYWTDRGKEVPGNLHWHALKSADAGFEAMLKGALLINTLTNESLTKITDPDKTKYNQFIKLLSALHKFTDDRTGTEYGSVATWDTDKVLVIDALTGINSAAMSMVVGGKPIRSLVDWGVAIDQIERLLKMLTDGCRCHFVLLAHVERETDQVFGGVKITVGTLGNKLASRLPPMFSDVILTSRQGSTFEWSTANTMADLKARNVPISEKILPSFKQIVDKWTSRGGSIK